MRERQNPTRELLELADHQAGVLSSEQVAGFGLSRHSVGRLLSTGAWQSLDRGIYLAHRNPPVWESLAWAGVLLGGDRARLGGRAAGYLHQLVEEPPQALTVWVPSNRHLVSRGPWLFQRDHGDRSDRRYGSPPRLTIEDTVLDLCANDRMDRIPHWIALAVQTRRTTVPRLRQALEVRQRMAHRQLLQAVLADVCAGAETPLEIHYLHNVEEAHGLPRGERQTRSDKGPYRRDILYREYRLLVELDGRAGHMGPGAFRDMWRDNVHLTEGKATLRYGWNDVLSRPCAAAVQVVEVLTQAGWTGTFQRCPRCPQVG